MWLAVQTDVLSVFLVKTRKTGVCPEQHFLGTQGKALCMDLHVPFPLGVELKELPSSVGRTSGASPPARTAAGDRLPDRPSGSSLSCCFTARVLPSGQRLSLSGPGNVRLRVLEERSPDSRRRPPPQKGRPVPHHPASLPSSLCGLDSWRHLHPSRKVLPTSLVNSPSMTLTLRDRGVEPGGRSAACFLGGPPVCLRGLWRPSPGCWSLSGLL